MQQYGRNLLVKAAVILLLLLILFAGNILRRDRRNPDPAGVSDRLESSIDVGILEIRGSDAGTILRIRKSEGGWLVENMTAGTENRAREERIRAFLDDLLGMTYTRTVATSGDFSSYGLEYDSRRTNRRSGSPAEVILFDSRGRRIETFLFGLYNPDTSEMFFRYAEDAAVYGVSPDMGFYLDQSPEYWVEMRLWQPLRDGTTRRAEQFYRIYADGDSTVWTREGRLNWIADDGDIPESPEAVSSAADLLIRMEAESLYSVRGVVPDNAVLQLRVGVTTRGSEILEAAVYRLDTAGSRHSPRYLVEPLRGPWFTSGEGMPRILEMSEREFERFLAF